MEKRQLKLAYEKLIMFWETERGYTDLSVLSDNELDYFMELQRDIHRQEHDSMPVGANDIAKNIVKELREDSCGLVDFFINDMLDIRIEKILDKCRRLDVIRDDVLTSAERDFYKNLMGAFRGYNKVRNVYSVLSDACHPDPHNEGDSDGAFCTTENYSLPADSKNYLYVKFEANIPSLVGADYIAYGPFKKEDFGRIPATNAQILEKEKLIQILK